MQNGSRTVELIGAVDANIRIRREIHSCGDVRGFFPDGRAHGKGRIAKITRAYARRQYCTTLRASFSHRLVLRCGRFHSGEEGTSQEYHYLEMSIRKNRRMVAKETACRGGEGQERTFQASICWASMSRLNEMRRSKATAAKYAQCPRSNSVQTCMEGTIRATVERRKFKILK